MRLLSCSSKLIPMRPLLILLVFCSPLWLFAGNDNFPVGARSGGMANASLTVQDVWAVHHNQAAIAFLEAPEVGIFSESRFLVPGVGLRAGVFVLPTSSGTFGVELANFGYSAYNESKVGLAYARKFGDKLAFGLQLDYLRTHIAEGYGNKSAFAAEVGVLAKITDELTIGAHVYNPNRAKISDFNNERSPAILRLGFGYTFSEKVMVTLETEKDIGHKAVVRGGLEYHISEPLYLRTGIASNPLLNTYGFGLNMKQFKLDFAASYHTTLGFSPQVSLGYVIN